MQAPWELRACKGGITVIDCESIGARVKYHRVRVNMSQEELAYRANISRVQIGRLERGERQPSLEALINIANALNVTADDLLAGNLLNSGSVHSEDQIAILTDCTKEETQILLQNMQSLKKIIRAYKISK